MLGGTVLVTVGGDAAGVERRLTAGVLRCPCGGVLTPWSHAVKRVIATVVGPRTVRPRRSRCGVCSVTHVLLPTRLFSRRKYAGLIIWACFLARVNGAKVASIGRRVGVPASTVAGWLRRLGGERAERWRRVLMGVLGMLDARVRPVEPGGGVPGGGRLGEALAVLGAVAAAVRGRGRTLSTVTDQQVASHLSRGLLLAPSWTVESINTSPFLVPA